MRYLANTPCMSPMTLRQQLLHTARTAQRVKAVTNDVSSKGVPGVP